MFSRFSSAARRSYLLIGFLVTVSLLGIFAFSARDYFANLLGEGAPASALTVSGGGVNTAYQPWAAWVSGAGLHENLVVQIYDGAAQWGADIPVILAAEKTWFSFSFPGNVPPSQCNLGKKCAIQVRLFDPAHNTFSNSLSLELPAVENTEQLPLETVAYDIIVAGAGTGGSAAAIQAARMGAKVALLEETDCVGGQMNCAGVSTMDEAAFLNKNPNGIFKEFFDQVQKYYDERGKSVGTCGWGTLGKCFEPHIGQMILRQMIAAEPNITLYEQTKIKSVLKSGDKVTGIVTTDGKSFQSKVLIDATEYGDLIPLTGARYRVGNSTSDAVNSQACIQDITYPITIQKYPNGVPPELRMTTPPPGYADAKQEFAHTVAKNGSAFSWPPQYPVNWLFHVGYRALPDSAHSANYDGTQPEKITKTGVNWANDYPGYAEYNPQGVNKRLKTTYLTDPEVRTQENCAAKLKTLQFLYYVQDELGEVNWSIATDEKFDTPYNISANNCPNIPAEFKAIEKYFPVMPYVRESIRIIPVQTLTAAHIKREGSPARARQNFSGSLAVGDYFTDLHNCNTDDTLEKDLGESIQDRSPGGIFQVPFEAFIPEKIDGFLAVEKNLGVSRLAAGSIRLQPITMSTGMAGGAIAAVAARQSIEPRQVNPLEVQKALLDAKSFTSLYHFPDVPVQHPSWKAVQLASTYQTMIGSPDGTFGIEKPLLRREIAIIGARIFQLSVATKSAHATFEDVPAESPGFDAVEAFFREGISIGCSLVPRKFCPTDPVTKAQLAVFLVRGLDLPLENTTSSRFTDVPKSHPALRFIETATRHGLLTGCSATEYCPEKAVLRSDMAEVISRLLLKDQSLAATFQ